jgi:hypothetical protein
VVENEVGEKKFVSVVVMVLAIWTADGDGGDIPRGGKELDVMRRERELRVAWSTA